MRKKGEIDRRKEKNGEKIKGRQKPNFAGVAWIREKVKVPLELIVIVMIYRK